MTGTHQPFKLSVVERAVLGDQRRHTGALSVIAAERLVAGDLSGALLLAERRSRLRVSRSAAELTLHARILKDLGRIDDARAALTAALTNEPGDAAATALLTAMQPGVQPAASPGASLQARLRSPGGRTASAPRSNLTDAEVLQRTRVPASPADLTVIVPVYGDADATRACLASVTRQRIPSGTLHVLVVDDATPEADLAADLDHLAEAGRIRLLRNPDNLGFIGSVNRALSLVENGDVLLLNADTLVPPGAIGRLVAAVRAAGDIGTAVPFSNSAEDTSFPTPSRSHPMPLEEELAALDRATAAANGRDVVDILTGTGFCMLVTRACLKRLPRLDTAMERGYFEDVAYCLAARRAGLRNVCATGVFVGHVGTRSFGSEKPGLVHRNLQRLRRAEPGYMLSSSIFDAKDPLRRARGRIERELMRKGDFATAIVVGTGFDGALLADLASRHDRALFVQVSAPAASPSLALRAASGGWPQSLVVQTATAADQADAIALLAEAGVTRVVLADPAGTPRWLVDAARARFPLHLVIVDAGLVCPRRSLTGFDGQRCSSEAADDLCQTCAAHATAMEPVSGHPAAGWRKDWHAAATTMGSLRLEDCRRDATAPGSDGTATPVPATTLPAPGSGGVMSRIGFVVPTRNALTFRLVCDLGHALQRQAPRLDGLVFGPTFDDVALIRATALFPLGNVPADQLGNLARQLAVDILWIVGSGAIFSTPLLRAAYLAGLPVIDQDVMSRGAVSAAGLLRLRIEADPDELVASMLSWLPTRGQAA